MAVVPVCLRKINRRGGGSETEAEALATELKRAGESGWRPGAEWNYGYFPG